MKKFTYIDNKTATELFVVITDDILKADEMFQKETGINLIKSPWIGVTLDNP